jgi:hypothetical protein
MPLGAGSLGQDAGRYIAAAVRRTTDGRAAFDKAEETSKERLS